MSTVISSDPSLTDPGVAVLGATDVSVRFGGISALSNVSIEVSEAEIVGLVGPNGAGKSTLLAVLSGLLRPQTGRVFIGEEEVSQLSAQLRARRGLARTFQHPELFADLSVREHLVLGHRVRFPRKRLLTDLFTGKGLMRPDRSEDDAVDHIIDLLELNRYADRSAYGLPLGLCRLVEVGRALSTEPKVLLLDEPSSGLDRRETEQLTIALDRVRTQGVAMVLVEHDVDMVLGLSDSVVVLDFGLCIGCGTPDEIRASAQVRAAYLGDEIAETPVKEEA